MADTFEELLARANTPLRCMLSVRFARHADLATLSTPICSSLGRALPQCRVEGGGRGWAFVGDAGDALVFEQLSPPTHDGPSGIRTTLLAGPFIVRSEDWQDRLSYSLVLGAREQHLLGDGCTALAKAAKSSGQTFVCDHVDVAFARLRALGPCRAALVFTPGLTREFLAATYSRLRDATPMPMRALAGSDSEAWGCVGAHEDLVLGHRYYLSAADGETEGWALLVDDVGVSGSFGVDYGDSFHHIEVRANDATTLARVVAGVCAAAASYGCTLMPGHA